MDRSGLEQAAKLLDKARSTDSDPEAIALVLATYRQLAKAITQYDIDNGETEFGPRRRERRLIADRRARAALPTVYDPDPVAIAGASYSAASAITERESHPRVNLHL